MSQRFTDWKAAHDEAQKTANRTGLEVELRAVKEYGKLGYNVRFACQKDPDYARAEIVRPVRRTDAP